VRHLIKRPTGFGKPSRSGDTPKDVTANAVKKAAIICTPGKRLKETLNNRKYTKVS